MEIKITGTPKEIADLVLGIQSQQLKEVLVKCVAPNNLNLYEVVKKEQILQEADEKYLYNLAEREVNLAFGIPKEVIFDNGRAFCKLRRKNLTFGDVKDQFNKFFVTYLSS